MNKEYYINKKFLHDRGEFNKDINKNARAFAIANEIAGGSSYRQIIAKYMKEWGVSYSYMRTAINEAIETFADDNVYKNLKAVNNERLSDIYSEARQQGRLAEAIRAVDTLNKLNNLYELPKTEVKVETEDSNIVITFGGESIELVEKKYLDADFEEVDDLIKNVLDESNEEV